MKKLTNSEIEAKLRAMHLEDSKDKMMPLEEMKKRAAYEYEIRQRIQTRKQKPGISRRLAIAMSIAICLISGSFLFSALAPTVVSSANDFMRRAGIWVNDVLQLGIEVERPIEGADDGLSTDAKTKTEFTSVEEASEYFGVPLLKLKDDVDGYLLTPPEAVLGVDPFYSLQYSYSSKNDSIGIEFEQVLEETEIDVLTNATQIDTTIGSFFVWVQNNETELLTFIGGFAIRISTTMSPSATIDYLSFCE